MLITKLCIHDGLSRRSTKQLCVLLLSWATKTAVSAYVIIARASTASIRISVSYFAVYTVGGGTVAVWLKRCGTCQYDQSDVATSINATGLEMTWEAQEKY